MFTTTKFLIGCESSYKNLQDIKKASKICSNTGNSKQHIETNFSPAIFKNKITYIMH
jgi:hypothetical protein